MKLPKEGINELSKDGYDWIAIKVLFKVGKVWFCIFRNFNHIIRNHSAVLKCSPFILHHSTSLGWCQYCGISINVLYARPERSNLDLCYLFRLIYQKQCMLWPKFYETHIESHIWSFRLLHDLWLWMTQLKGEMKVTEFSRGCIS
jgi:hypothetical protein